MAYNVSRDQVTLGLKGDRKESGSDPNHNGKLLE